MFWVVPVERQWVIAVQYGSVLGGDGLFPGATKDHTEKLKLDTQAHAPEDDTHESLQIQRTHRYLRHQAMSKDPPKTKRKTMYENHMMTTMASMPRIFQGTGGGGGTG